MSAIDDVAAIAPHGIWDGILARTVDCERITLAVVELGPGAIVPHRAETGPDGAVVPDVFSPTRDDWRAGERVQRQQPRWPRWPR